MKIVYVVMKSDMFQRRIDWAVIQSIHESYDGAQRWIDTHSNGLKEDYSIEEWPLRGDDSQKLQAL